MNAAATMSLVIFFLGQCTTDKVFEIAGSEDLAYGSDSPDFEGGLVVVVLFHILLSYKVSARYLL